MTDRCENVLKEIKRIDAKTIVLRRFDMSDAGDLLAFASDAKTVKNLDWGGVKTLEEANQMLEEYYIPAAGAFAIALKDTGRCIGSISLNLEPAHEKASFGYVLNRAYWNKGYVSEALAALIAFAFDALELNRIESKYYAGNEASGRVMEKCGMKREGISQQAIKNKGVFRDVVFYGILRKDFRTIQENRP